MSTARLKWIAITCFIVAMAGLLGGGFAARERVAPYPGRVVDPAGNVLFTRADILAGQDVYQRYGLMDHGSVWGHGSQRGTEFSAVTLHEWGVAVQTALASAEHGKPVEAFERGRAPGCGRRGGGRDEDQPLRQGQ